MDDHFWALGGAWLVEVYQAYVPANQLLVVMVDTMRISAEHKAIMQAGVVVLLTPTPPWWLPTRLISILIVLTARVPGAVSSETILLPLDKYQLIIQTDM